EGMLADERHVLAEDSQRAATTGNSTRFLTVVVSGVGIGFLGLATIAVNREVRAGANVRAQLWELNSTLEQRVEERTSALQTEIAERKSAEEANLRLAAIVESSTDAIIGKDLNGTITNWNHKTQRLFGYSNEEIVGRSISLLMPPALRHEQREILERIHH